MKNLDIELGKKLDDYSNIDALTDNVTANKLATDVDLAEAEVRLAEAEVVVANLEAKLATSEYNVSQVQSELDTVNRELGIAQMQIQSTPSTMSFLKVGYQNTINTLTARLPELSNNLAKYKLELAKIKADLLLAKVNVDSEKNKIGQIKNSIITGEPIPVVIPRTSKPSIKNLLSQGIPIKKDLSSSIKPISVMETKTPINQQNKGINTDNEFQKLGDSMTNYDNKILGMPKPVFWISLTALVGIGGFITYRILR